MYRKINAPKTDYPLQLLILFGLIVGFIVVAVIITVALWMGLTGKGFMSMEKDMLNPVYTNASKITQVVATVFMFFMPAFVFALIVSKNPFQQMGFQKKLSMVQVGLIILIAFFALFLSGSLATLNEMIPISAKWAMKFKKMEEAYNEQVKIMAKMSNIKEYFFSLIVIALAPAIVEEVFFRGTLQRLFHNWFKNAWVALIITSLIFSAIHFSYYGFLPRFALGIILGLMFIYTKNIWVSILAHFLNNGMAVTAMYLYRNNPQKMDEAMKDNFPLYWGLIVLPLIVFFFILLKKESDKIGATQLPNHHLKMMQDDNPFHDDLQQHNSSANTDVLT